jgi:Sel1 repeat
MRGLPNLQRTVGGVAAKIFFAHSHGGSRISRGGDVSGRISIPICITAAAALLVSGIGTDLQATTRANDCLTAPNASSPRGQHWYYHMDLPNNRKCWYLHAPLMHRAAKASESHAVSTTADTPVSGSRADSAPRLPHSRILSVKPQPTSFVSAKSIHRGDPTWVQQENVPQGNALHVDGSKPTDAAATSAAAKPIEQSDASSIPQQNVPQESTLQVGGSKSTDAVVASSPAITTFRVAGADSAPPDADSEAFHDGGRIAERSNPTIKADIVRGLSFKPVQIFLLLVFGVAIVVISLMIIIHRRVTAVMDFQLDHEQSEAQAKHGWQDDRADARSSQMFVDNRRGQDGIDSPSWWMQPSVKRPQDRDATSTEPPRPSLEDVKAAPEHFKAALIYENRTQNRDYTFMYAPSWARRKPPMVAAHETSIERPPQDHVVDAARPFSGDLAVEDSRRRRSLTPEIVPEPKFLKGDHTRALIALRLSGVTAIAALIAWVVVSLPAMHRQPGNDNVHTAVLANPTDGEQDQLPTTTARSPLNDRRLQANEPRANGGSEERQSGMTTVMAGPVTDAFIPATASPSTGSRLERTTVQPDEEEISALIKLAQGFLSNRDISSARLLLRRAAEAGSAAAALSLGETFDPLVIRQLHAIGVQPDPAKAREWYERAAQLGSDAASQHLAKLAQSPQ